MIIPITIGLIIGIIAFAAGALKMVWDTFSGPVFVIILIIIAICLFKLLRKLFGKIANADKDVSDYYKK